MSDLKSRVLSATAYPKSRGGGASVSSDSRASGAREENARLKPFMELLGDALQLIHENYNCNGSQIDTEDLLTRANALLTKGDAK